jgi:hypothetical protein
MPHRFEHSCKCSSVLEAMRHTAFMDFQKWLPVAASIIVILLVAYLREQSRTLAAILATMPINIPLALWVVFGAGEPRQEDVAAFVRALLPGIIATTLWIAIVAALLHYGVRLLPAIGVGYAVWAVLIALFVWLGWVVARR